MTGTRRPLHAISGRFDLALLPILIAGLGARLYRFTSPVQDMFSFRQAQTMGTVRCFMEDGIDLLRPQLITLGRPGVLVLEFPIYQAIIAAVSSIIGSPELVARALTIAMCLIAAIYVYMIGRREIGRPGGLLAALFFLFSPLYLFFGRTPLIDIMQLTLSLAGLWHYLRGMDAEGKRIHLVVAAVLTAVALLIKPPGALPIVALVILVLLRSKPNPVDWRPIVALIAPLVAMLLWQRHANQTNVAFNEGRYPFEQLRWAIDVKLWPINAWYFGTGAQRLQTLGYSRIADRLVYEVFAVVGVIPAFVALLQRAGSKLLRDWFLLVVAACLLFFNLNVVHNYYQLPFVPIAALLTADGVVRIIRAIAARSTSRIVVGGAVIGICLAYLISAVWVVDQVGYYRLDSHTVELGASMRAALRDDDLVAFVGLHGPDFWAPHLMYEAGKRGFVVPEDEFDPEMLDMLEREDVVWLVMNRESPLAGDSPLHTEVSPDVIAVRIDEYVLPAQ